MLLLEQRQLMICYGNNNDTPNQFNSAENANNDIPECFQTVVIILFVAKVKRGIMCVCGGK
jgi:hypothetical protein